MSFQQGLSGLNASSKNLEIIGNNIANANTFGSKASRAEFADLYAASLSGAGTSSVGIGTKLSTVAQQFTQGNITITENPMDLAINGGGFFQLSDGKNPTFYSRNGQFKVDKQGFIVNNDNLKLLGYSADGTGAIKQGLAQPLQLPTKGIDPQATSTVKMEFNLDSREKGSAPYTQPDPSQPNYKVDVLPPKIQFADNTTYNKATSYTAYDQKGQPIAVTMYFQRANPPMLQDPLTNKWVADPNGDTVWNIYVTANGTPVQQDAQGNITTSTTDANGNYATTTPFTRIVFGPKGGVPKSADADGNALQLDDIALILPPGVNAGGAPTLRVPYDDPANPAPPDPVTGKLPHIALDFSQVSLNGSSFAVTDLSQNGYAPGQLTGIQVEKNGIVTARYSNGQSKAAGQIELSTFRNNQGLQPLGGNIWARSNASGEPVSGVPGDGNLGVLSPGSLEESNVDLTGELVNMVTAQRVYQANAQTIKTLNDVLQTLVNLR